MSKKIEQFSNGLLHDSYIQILADHDHLSCTIGNIEKQIQPASVDLRLGKKAYRIRASFLPGDNTSVSSRLEQLTLHEFPLEDGAVLETNCVYLVPLLEHLDLPEDIAASANPKSSTGRLDVFTRLICDNSAGFDTIPKGYKGPLYAEIIPKTFPILVRTGSTLSQIRFRKGDSRLDGRDLHELHKTSPLVNAPKPRIEGNGLALSVDLEGNEDGLVGYRAKRHSALIDIDKPNSYPKADYWEPIYKNQDRSLILDPDEFYILASKEAVTIPPDYAAEMIPFDPIVGEFRVHYAGFFDPGFGHSDAGGIGSRAVLEVRSHDVPFILEHGQNIGGLVYEKMCERPTTLYSSAIGSNYQAQGLKLAKHFK